MVSCNGTKSSVSEAVWGCAPCNGTCYFYGWRGESRCESFFISAGSLVLIAMIREGMFHLVGFILTWSQEMGWLESIDEETNACLDLFDSLNYTYYHQNMTSLDSNIKGAPMIPSWRFPRLQTKPLSPWHPRPGESHPPRRDKTCGVNHAIPHLHTSRFKVTLSIPHETTLPPRFYFRPLLN